ncbi:protein NBR1 homolog [Herrania umbratica]|uniref:Protein NBR1 homolog n=1 Tax=Herrania umbratica TaxID=108875 RepID=A0A6J1B0E8_9ROSI|nr:protein NBR1 homolog [Herrania umbratica]
MESNLVIKVKYGHTLRRFNAGIDDAEQLDLNMAGLRAKIIGLFNFPADAELTLTYIDEDGDVVTLVDDNDLRDVMRQRLKFLRIDVRLNNDKFGKLYAGSSGSSTPLRSPSVQPPLASFNTGAADVLKSVPEPLRDALSEVFSKLSFDVPLKVASASPVLGDLVECLSKMGQSYLSPVSQSGAGANTNIPVGTSESPSAPSAPTDPNPSRDAGLQAVLPKCTADDSSCRASKEANNGNATGGVNVPAAVDLNVDPPADVNLTGCATMTSGSSASNKKNTKESNSHNKGKSVSLDTSTPLVDTTRKYYPINGMGPSNECPFSGVPVANDPVVPPFLYHPFSPSKRSSTHENPMFGTFHKGIQCDGCGVLPITGPRFKSKVTDDYDLCSICFSKMGNEADYIRMDRPLHYRHPWCFRASNDHIPRAGGPALPHVLRNRVMKSARPKLDSRFILDVSVLDGTVMAPSTPFTKIWRMRNNGTLPWCGRMQLVWIGGDKFSDATSVEIEIPADGVPVDGELDIAIDFTAPQLPGRYVSYWRMASQTGMKFGQRVWVLIHVDTSIKESISDNFQGLNLNLPPESSGPRDPEIVDMNVDLVTELCNSNAGNAPLKPMVNDQPAKEHTVYNSLLLGSDVPIPVPTSSSVTYPIIDQGVFVPVHQPPTLSSPAAYPNIDQRVSSPAFPHIPSPSVSYPMIDLSEAAPTGPFQAPPPAICVQAPSPAGQSQAPAPAICVQAPSPAGPSQAPAPAICVQAPSPAISVQAPSQEDIENESVEQTLLKELEEMGFKQVDLNKEILRMNEYDLEKSVDDLCGVAEWDPILEELQEMGFCDAEMNKKLLKKNNGSIKGVVMDLLTGERA